MKIRKSAVQKLPRTALVVLTLFVVVATTTLAEHRVSKLAQPPAIVTTHLALSGGPANQLVLQDRGGKKFLYVGQNSKHGVAIVDVTNPERPNIIARMAWPHDASAGNLQMVGSGIAISEARDNEFSAPGNFSPAETLNVLDLTDPANPRAIQSFSGVTSSLVDTARSLVYITNGNGLWILKNKQHQAVDSSQHTCSSEDALNDVASCQ